MKRLDWLLAVLGLGMVLCFAAAASLRQPDHVGWIEDALIWRYAAWTVGAGALYAVAAWLVLHRPTGQRTLVLVLLGAVLLRSMVAATPPLLSTDLYRYVWDGKVQAAGINPYLHLPADTALQPLRDAGRGAEAIYPNINRADYAPTIYPPAAQAIFAAVGVLWPTIWGVKAAMLAFDALGIAAALLLLHLARQPLARVLILAWNPLVVWEFGGGGHIDAAALGFSALALLAAAWRRPALAGAVLAGAVLCKLLPAALFPALWRRWDLRMPLACAAVIIAGYACYSGAGWHVFGFLPGYAAEEAFGSGGGFLLIRLLHLLGPVPGWVARAYLVVGVAALFALAAAVSLRARLPEDGAARAVRMARDAGLLAGASMFVLSPHYPWYLTALALPAVLIPHPALLWPTLAAPLLYLDYDLRRVGAPAAVFLPAAALLAAGLVRRPHRSTLQGAT